MPYPGLADRLRKAGLRVKEHPGWQVNRQSDRLWAPKYVVLHHTAGVGAGLERFIANGTASIRGPWSQFLIKRDGTVVLISAGRANHAGTGGPWKSVPRDSMNSYGWGIEIESNGRVPDYTPVQWTAVHRTTAVLLEMMGVDEDNVLRHRDWAPGRKVDTKYPLLQHRRAVQLELAKLRGKPKPAPKPAPAPSKGAPRTLKRGMSGRDVLSMQRALAKVVKGFSYRSGPGNFGPKTEEALKKFQRSQKLAQDGVFGPKARAALVRAIKPKPVPKHRNTPSVVEVSNVQPGDTGGDVALVQKALLKLGYSIPALRSRKAKFGVFGPQTRAAYAQWQKKLGYRGTDADGDPGFASLSALGKKSGLFKVVNK